MLATVSSRAGCPRCGTSTYRAQLPLLLRPLRMVLPHVTFHRCYGCRWRGLAR